MYTLSNNMARPYTINLKTGFDKTSAKPLVKKYRLLPGAAGEMEIEDDEAAAIKKIGGPIDDHLKAKRIELKKVAAPKKEAGKKSDDDIAS